jgi:hypothetical protein
MPAERMPEHDLLDDPIGQQALALLRPRLLAPILDHSVRTLILASAECRLGGGDVDPVDLLIACLFHDSGTIPDRSPERFEVVGADRATVFAREVGRDADSRRAIWDAIALHTSPGIAERHRPLTQALRSGVLTDFGSPVLVDRQRALIQDVEERYPRAGIERVLAGAVVEAARTTPSKAPSSSWPADLVRGASTRPEVDNPNF